MGLNKDIEKRDKLIFGRYREKKYEYDGKVHFGGIDHKVLGQLLEQGFVDGKFRYNHNSPMVNEIYDFMNTYHAYCCHGYVTSIGDDYGIYLTGIEKGHASDSPQEFKRYMALFGKADKIDVNNMNCLFEKEG